MSSEIERPGDAAAEPVANPGLPEHQWRPQDVDEAQAKRTERQIVAMFGVATILLFAFVVFYIVIDTEQTFLGFSALNVALGGCLGGALLLIGVGVIQWAKKLMTDHEIIEMRHPAASSAEDREATLEVLRTGAEESGIGRRPLIRNSLLGAVAALGLPAVVLLRDLGPSPSGQDETVWRQGMRVVNDVSGEPLRPAEIEVGQLVNAEPAILFETDEDGEKVLHGSEALAVKAKAAVILVRIEPDEITPESGRENWGVDGILCYSKICTHVGCPISLYEQQTHNVLCPCHQSTFDLADNGRVVFGPARRRLPQLPLGVDSEGYLIAMSDFPDIAGPSYPELARDQEKLDDELDGES